MERITVAHFVNNLQLGGVLSVIENYCSLLDPSLFEHHIIYIGEEDKQTYNYLLANGFILHKTATRRKHLLKNIKDIKVLFKQNRFDVVHSHLSETSFIPLYFAKAAKVPIRIAHCHNYDVRKKGLFKYFAFSVSKRLTNRYCNKRVSCGVDAGKYLFNDKPFIVLRNAIDVDKYQYNPSIREKLLNDYNIKEGSLVVGNIGRLCDQKNQTFLLDIFNELNNNIYLIMIGSGPNEQKIVERINLIDSNRIILISERKDAFLYYNMFDVFVLPSLWEGLPVVGVEAQASGLPCVFSNNVTNEIRLLPSVTYLPLNKKSWVDYLNSFKSEINRTKYFNEIKDNYCVSDLKNNVLDLYTIKN